MDIYLDFDGTLVEHEHPRMGRLNVGCLEVIEKLQKAGHRIIMNTYRADCNDGTLEQAVDWFNNNVWHELKPLDGINKVKSYAPPWSWDFIRDNNCMFIDDQATGIPLKRAVMTHGKMVDWDELNKQFEINGIYNPVTPTANA